MDDLPPGRLLALIDKGVVQRQRSEESSPAGSDPEEDAGETFRSGIAAAAAARWGRKEIPEARGHCKDCVFYVRLDGVGTLPRLRRLQLAAQHLRRPDRVLPLGLRRLHAVSLGRGLSSEKTSLEPRVSFITLGVRDLERATRFYKDVLGLPQLPSPPGVVSFFEMGRTWLALFPREDLAADAGVTPEGSGFPGFALAHNVRSEAEVDQLLAEAAAGGGRIVKPGQPTDWGGYAGYFADPDGFLWEVAWNPKFPHV